MSEPTTFQIFETALRELQEGVHANGKARSYFSDVNLARILETRLVQGGLPVTEIYDHRSFQRRFHISEDLLKRFEAFWSACSSSEGSRVRMCQLFFLHEFYHLEQRIDSNTYAYSRNTKATIGRFDVDADSIAVELLFILTFDAKGPDWAEALAAIIEDHILCGEAFSIADDNRDGVEIAGPRLRRQLIWHLHLARARSFPSGTMFSDFGLSSLSQVELLRLEHVDRRTNLTEAERVAPADLDMVELQLTWRGKRIVQEMTIPAITGRLKEAVFRLDFSAAPLAFRSLFERNTELIQPPNQDSGAAGTLVVGVESPTEWGQLEKLLCELLPDGPNENEFWSRAGGNRSALNSNRSGIAQWHAALRLIRNGGGGLTLDKLLETLAAEFPGSPAVHSILNGEM